MFLAALTDLSTTEYMSLAGVLLVVFGMLQKQIQFSNKLASEHAKQREQDLDKISAALIIIQEQGRGTTEMCKEVVGAAREISENQKLLAKDMETMKQLALSKDSKQS